MRYPEPDGSVLAWVRERATHEAAGILVPGLRPDRDSQMGREGLLSADRRSGSLDCGLSEPGREIFAREILTSRLSAEFARSGYYGYSLAS